MSKTVYMDYNATTPLLPAVKDAIVESLSVTGNPSSVHKLGRQARAMMEDAREAVAKLVNVPSDWVIFTSGGTESDFLALKGANVERILVSAVEHAAVLNAVENIQTINVDGNGLIDLEHLEEMLKSDDRPTLVSVMAANNETGVLQPIEAIVEIAQRYGAFVHCDAVQAVGKIEFDMRALDCDLVSLSAHKIGGPRGVGALVVKEGFKLNALHQGGGQEKSLRGGTENLSGIIGFGTAAKEKIDYCAVETLRNDLEKQIKELSDDVVIIAEDVERLPTTSCFALKGMASDRQVMALDLAGVMISAGSACSSGKVKASHVLQAMGLDDDIAGCAIRVSLGWGSTKDDIDVFLQAWSKLAKRVEAKKSDRSAA